MESEREGRRKRRWRGGREKGREQGRERRQRKGGERPAASLGRDLARQAPGRAAPAGGHAGVPGPASAQRRLPAGLCASRSRRSGAEAGARSEFPSASALPRRAERSTAGRRAGPQRPRRRPEEAQRPRPSPRGLRPAARATGPARPRGGAGSAGPRPAGTRRGGRRRARHERAGGAESALQRPASARHTMAGLSTRRGAPLQPGPRANLHSHLGSEGRWSTGIQIFCTRL